MQMKIHDLDADGSLLYAIQQSTKQSSADILVYFQHLTKELINSLKNSKGRHKKRRLVSFYPSTGIAFQLDVDCWTYHGEETVHLSLEFPKLYMRVEGLGRLANELAEAELLGSALPNIPSFRAPELKAPRGKRYLINE